MIIEHCYRPGCDRWVTGASDYCSEACETEGREFRATISRVGDYYALQAANAMDRLRAEAEAAVVAYETYLATLKEKTA